MSTKHMKLVGGSINTAKHDLDRMKVARDEVAARRKEIEARWKATQKR